MKAWILLLGIISVSGCQLLAPQHSSCTNCDAPETTEQQHERAMQQLAGGNYLPEPSAVIARPGKPLSDYAADLAMQLMQSMHYKAPQHTIAISSFVRFDQQLNNTNAVGNQLSEHMYFQLQRLGFKVADVKLARQIRITPRGEFALSRGEYLDLQQHAAYVLTGTMLRDSAGIVVNARVMHLQSKTVLGSGQIHIPNFVLAAPAGIEPATAP
jgi:TolB-like protein